MINVEFVMDTGIDLKDGSYTTMIDNMEGNKSEKAVQEILENQGYNTKNLNPSVDSIFHNEDIPDTLFYILLSNKIQNDPTETSVKPLTLTKTVDKTGMPDILAWKESNNRAICPIFIEVKKDSDNLRPEQIKWMKENDFIKAGVAYIETPEKS